MAGLNLQFSAHGKVKPREGKAKAAQEGEGARRADQRTEGHGEGGGKEISKERRRSPRVNRLSHWRW